MATRKKTTRKKATKKKATRKKATGKRAPGKKRPAPARKKAASARRTARKKTARQAAPKRKPAEPRETPEAALVRRILAAAADPSKFDIADLYTLDCVSIEGNGMRVEGHAGLRAKVAEWQAGLESSTWEARHVFTRPGAIAIEWDAQIKFKDGRSVRMNELAVHELRGGKIAAERYFYDPAALAPSEPRTPYTPSNVAPRRDDSGIDPMDL